MAEKAVAPHYTFQSTLLMRGATTDTPITTMIGKTFQSTLLMRGATASSQSSAVGGLNFNPRSSCEERLIPLDNLTEAAYFNPRSSCEERPRYLLSRSAERPYFNPRSSCEERRHTPWQIWPPASYFNPRSSCEERRRSARSISVRTQFQSTLLMRGATAMLSGPPNTSLHFKQLS